jgi:hypothetical protein
VTNNIRLEKNKTISNRVGLFYFDVANNQDGGLSKQVI